MAYLKKKQNSEKLTVASSLILALIYTDLNKLILNINSRKFWIDTRENVIPTENSLSLYLACWKLSCLTILDLVEDKLGYEKNHLKVLERLSLDLGTDSVDLVEMALHLERVVGIPIYENVNFEKLVDLIDYIFFIYIKRLKSIKLVYNSIDLKI
uniref:Acyl carrier protein n=1 Tax=Characiopsis acuta TaxID=2040456 RepID=A0A3R5WW63_9STRA|nr:acyl carrier protein [Characiopsis acuta]QAA11274.1 acyl carrier protein [Characiopsis acuta]